MIDCGKLLILIATSYTIATPYNVYNLVDPAFMQGEVQSGYSKRAYSFTNQRLLVPAWR